MTEVWMPVFGYEDFYSISNLGNAARVTNQGPAARKTWKPLRKYPTNNGYVRFCFCVDNKRDFQLAHRAIWQAFNGGIPEGMTINHKNGVKTDNRIENLEVCTPSENSKHAYRVLGIPAPNNPNPGSRNGRAKLSEADIPKIREMIAEGLPKIQIAKQFSVSPALIYFIANGTNWRHV